MLAGKGDRDRTRSRLDGQIQALKLRHKEELRPLNEAWNELAPILQLPPEILSQIFTLATCTDWVKWKDLSRISHVCRHWRLIAIGCPSFWSRISINSYISVRVLEEMLSRSKASPLVVCVHDETTVHKLPPALWSQLLDMKRLQDLCIGTKSYSWGYYRRDILDLASGTSAMHLQSLFLKQLTIPPKLLSIPMTRLRHLVLWDCMIPWDSMHCQYPALISLELASHSTPIAEIPSRKPFYSMLSHSPNLEHLELHSMLPEPSPDTIPIAELPKLTSCILKASSLAACLDFQTHVAYPIDKATIEIHTSDSAQTMSTEAPSIEALLASCGVAPSDPRNMRTVLDMYGGVYPIVDRSLSSEPHLRSVPPRVKIKWRDNIVGRMVSTLEISMAGVQSLTVIVHCSSPNTLPQEVERWTKFFKKRNNITDLECRGSILSILTALSVSPDENIGDVDIDQLNHSLTNLPADPTTFRPLLPQLVNLTLCDHGAVAYNPNDSDWHAELRALRGFIEGRHACGCQIQNLKFWECYGIDLNDDFTGSLRSKVGNLHWEGAYRSRVESGDEGIGGGSDSE